MEVLQTSINHVFAVLSDECLYNLPQIYPNSSLALERALGEFFVVGGAEERVG
jgi:hypothetical protein